MLIDNMCPSSVSPNVVPLNHSKEAKKKNKKKQRVSLALFKSDWTELPLRASLLKMVVELCVFVCVFSSSEQGGGE